MTTSSNKILAKIQKLEEYIRYLKDLQKVNKNSFVKDYHFFGLAEHYLHLSIEALLDTAKLIIINKKLERPEEPQDSFRILFEKKILNKKLFERLSGITGFRNILIHEYEKTDKQLLYMYLQKNIGQFVEFKKQIIRFIRKS